MAKKKAAKKKGGAKKKTEDTSPVSNGNAAAGSAAVAVEDPNAVTAESIAAAKGNAEIPIVDMEPTDEDLAEVQVPTDENLDEDSLQKIFDDASKDEATSFALKMAEVDCPTCGEVFEVGVDPSEQGQEMIQDCQACCHPIGFTVEFVEGEAIVSSFRSD
jgi:hypothetical protein